MDRNLALEFVRITEAAALCSSKWMGRGDEKSADQAAVDAMRKAFDTVQSVRQQDNLLTKLQHRFVAFPGILIQGSPASQLHNRRCARQRRVDHLSNRIHDFTRRCTEAKSPAAHRIRLAERVCRNALVQHSRLREQRMMLTLPDHVAVRFVTEDSNVLSTHQVCNVAQVLFSRDASGRIVW